MNSTLTSNEIINQFIHFYYTSINNKNLDNIFKFIQNHTEIIFESQIFKGLDNTYSYYKNLMTSTSNIKIIDISKTSFAGRRCNIVVFGTIKVNDNEEKHFVESIIFQQGKKNIFWIHSSIFRFI